MAGIRTKAARDGGDWLISGAKTYITNGVQADWICLLVRTSDEGGYRGMSQVIVPTDTPGLTVSRLAEEAWQLVLGHRRAHLRPGPRSGQQHHR